MENTRFLFRARRTDEGECKGELIVGYLVKYGFTGKEKYYIVPHYASTLYAIPIDDTTICRCTGMTDNHGHLIFEKDVVEFKYGKYGRESDKYLLWWNTEGSEMTAVSLKHLCTTDYDYYDNDRNFTYNCFSAMIQDAYGDYTDISIVDNIIDNPQLVPQLQCNKEKQDACKEDVDLEF